MFKIPNGTINAAVEDAVIDGPHEEIELQDQWDIQMEEDAKAGKLDDIRAKVAKLYGNGI